MLRSAFLLGKDVITKINGTYARDTTTVLSSLDINSWKENLENHACS